MSAATEYAYPHRSGTKVRKSRETEYWRNGKTKVPLLLFNISALLPNRGNKERGAESKLSTPHFIRVLCGESSDDLPEQILHIGFFFQNTG